jgi:hypothetical protein
LQIIDDHVQRIDVQCVVIHRSSSLRSRATDPTGSQVRSIEASQSNRVLT